MKTDEVFSLRFLESGEITIEKGQQKKKSWLCPTESFEMTLL